MPGCGGTCAAQRGGSCPQRQLILANGLEHVQLDSRLCLVRPKSGKPRTILLLPQLVEALRRYLAATADRPNPHGLIWRNPDGSPITSGQDSAEWCDLLLTAGVITAEQATPLREQADGTPPAPTTHSARHATATILIELGVDARIIGGIVGHASEEITRHVCSHFCPHFFVGLRQQIRGRSLRRGSRPSESNGPPWRTLRRST